MDERACMAIGRNTHLQYLNLALASGITPDGLRTIFEGCRWYVGKEEASVFYPMLKPA